MLKVSKIRRAFGERQVLEDVSFSVAAGRMTGFVGSNGAGKTTTMRIILGVLAADSGEVLVDGKPITSAERARFGYMPEERGLYPKMQILEQIIYLARLHGMGPAKAKTAASDLLEKLGLGDRMNETVESLSLGNQQRAQIAAALVHEPRALILDEPFSGLDPLAIETVLGVLQEIASTGTPVLFSSHQLDIVERLCDDVVVINSGRIIAQGSREQLRAEHSGFSYRLNFAQEAGDTGWLTAQPGISVTRVAGSKIDFDAATPEAAQQVLREAVTKQPVASFSPVVPSLAEIFKEVIK